MSKRGTSFSQRLTRNKTPKLAPVPAQLPVEPETNIRVVRQFNLSDLPKIRAFVGLNFNVPELFIVTAGHGAITLDWEELRELYRTKPVWGNGTPVTLKAHAGRSSDGHRVSLAENGDLVFTATDNVSNSNIVSLRLLPVAAAALARKLEYMHNHGLLLVEHANVIAIMLRLLSNNFDVIKEACNSETSDNELKRLTTLYSSTFETMQQFEYELETKCLPCNLNKFHLLEVIRCQLGDTYVSEE